MIDAILAAGGRLRPQDPLYPRLPDQPKALLPVAGKPMAQWVLDALGAAQSIRRIIVMGLTPAEAAPLTCAKDMSVLPDQGSLLENLGAGARWLLARDPTLPYVLSVSVDIPALTPAAIDWNVSTALATDHDGYYLIIPQAVMEKRFPGARRSYFRIKEGRFTAGDMVLLNTRLLGAEHPLWPRLIAARKNIWQQAQLVGLGVLVQFLLGQITIPAIERHVQARLGVRPRVLVCPHAEAGMDVDKPHQLTVVERDLTA